MSRKTLAPIPTSLTLSALMLASSAFAADPPAKPADGASPDINRAGSSDTTLDQVTVQGQRDPKLSSPKQVKPVLDTPQTITVITAETLKEQGASTLVQALKNTPGISMLAGEGGTGGAPGDSATIRGFNARKDIFIDGVRDFGSYARDPFNLDQVEIVKGPSSFLGGRGSTGGAINLVTKQAQRETFYAGVVSGGTDAYRRLTLDVNQSLESVDPRLKDAAFRINAVGFEANTPGRDYVKNERMGVAPTLTFGLGSPTQVTVGFFHLDQDDLPDFGIPFVPICQQRRPRRRRLRQQGGTGQLQQLLRPGQSRPRERLHQHRLGGREARFRQRHRPQQPHAIRFDLSRLDPLGAALRQHDHHRHQPRAAVARRDRHGHHQPDRRHLQVHHRDGEALGRGRPRDRERELARLRTRRLRSGHIAGNFGAAEHGHGSVSTFPTTDLFNPDPFQPYSYSVQRTGAFTYNAAHSQAIYAFDTLDLDDRWSVMGGLRWDRFHDDANATTSDFTKNVLTSFTRTDKMLSWRASVSYKPAKNGSIYVSSGTSFNPSAEGLTLAAAANSLNSQNVGPEKNISYEVGTKWNLFDEKLLVTAALFRTEKTNARTEDPANPNDFVTLNGKARVQGLELGATGKLTREWGVQAGYAYMDGKIVSSANPLEVNQPLSSAPRNSGNLWTTYSFPSHVDIGAGATYVGKRVVNTTATRYVDGYATFDAMAAYRVNSRFTVRLNIYNLTDKRYVLDMYNTGSSGHVIPGSTRSAVLAGEFMF